MPRRRRHICDPHKPAPIDTEMVSRTADTKRSGRRQCPDAANLGACGVCIRLVGVIGGGKGDRQVDLPIKHMAFATFRLA